QGMSVSLISPLEPESRGSTQSAQSKFAPLPASVTTRNRTCAPATSTSTSTEPDFITPLWNLICGLPVAGRIGLPRATWNWLAGFDQTPVNSDTESTNCSADIRFTAGPKKTNPDDCSDFSAIDGS